MNLCFKKLDQLTWLAWDTSWDEDDVATGNGGLSLGVTTDEGGHGGLGVDVGQVGADAWGDGVDIVA